MSRVIAATGEVARTPYRIEKLERNIYSAEELCYLLVQSARILDAEIMDPSLVEWIERELKLPELAEQLKPLLGKERGLSDFVSVILDYVGFYPKEREEKTRQIVKTAAQSGQGLEDLNRRMARAGVLEENGQPYQALEEYESVLRALPAPEKRIRTQALCAEGRILAGLFLWHRAGECYRKAYDCSGRSDVFLRYLAAVRMELPDSEYLSFISEHPEAYNASLELEKRMQKVKADYDASEDKASIDLLKRYRDNHQDASYEVALHQTVEKLKKDYRVRQAPAV